MASFGIHRKREQGIALVMALVFLVLLTLIGITSLSTSSLEEKMANNTRDRNLALQAAETALTAGENWLASFPQADDWAAAVPSRGKYLPAGAGTQVWHDSVLNWVSGSNVFVTYPCNPGDADADNPSSCNSGGRQLLGDVMTQPKYIIERMGQVQATPLRVAYRITARGTGGTDVAVVMLQSTFVREF